MDRLKPLGQPLAGKFTGEKRKTANSSTLAIAFVRIGLGERCPIENPIAVGVATTSSEMAITGSVIVKSMS